MSLTDDDKRWIEQLIDARLAAVRDRKPVNPQELLQSNTLEQGGGLISRGTFFAPSSHGFNCRYCGMMYDAHKAYPRGACQDAVRQGG